MSSCSVLTAYSTAGQHLGPGPESVLPSMPALLLPVGLQLEAAQLLGAFPFPRSRSSATWVAVSRSADKDLPLEETACQATARLLPAVL